MMVPKNYLILSFCVCVCLLASAEATVLPSLDLWMTGYMTDTEIIVDVHRSNTGFDLGGLSYDLTFSETLEVRREYSDYEWIIEEYDDSSPADGVSGTLDSVTFDTGAEPFGSAFSEDEDEGIGIVERLTFSLPADETPRWIYFDLAFGSASDGNGQDLLSLDGAVNVFDADGLPEAHTFGVEIVPEAASLLLISAGAIFLRKRRK